MAPTVHKYFQYGLAPSTHKAYQAAINKFYSFCSTYDVHTPFPLTEHILCSFAAFMAEQGLAPQTVKSYLAAVRNMQISLGLPDPRDRSSFPRLKRVQAGIARLRMLQGSPHRVRLPVTPHIMSKVRESLSLSPNLDRHVIMVNYISERGSQPGPFFLNPDKSALTKSQFVSRFWATLQLLGFPQNDFAGHSFRIGAATTASSMGIEDSMIQTLGRWHSAAFLQYIRTPKEQFSCYLCLVSCPA